MKIKDANRLLKQLNEGQNISTREAQESIVFLEDLELVKVYKEKVSLTQKGNLAAGMGMQDYLKYHKTEKEILEFSIEKSRRNRKILMLVFFLLFSSFLAALFSNLPIPGSF